MGSEQKRKKSQLVSGVGGKKGLSVVSLEKKSQAKSSASKVSVSSAGGSESRKRRKQGP